MSTRFCYFFWFRLSVAERSAIPHLNALLSEHNSILAWNDSINLFQRANTFPRDSWERATQDLVKDILWSKDARMEKRVQ